MWKNCYEWRNTAEGVGIDELYRKIDPFDVCTHATRNRTHRLTRRSQYPERNHVFQFWPLFFHKARI